MYTEIVNSIIITINLHLILHLSDDGVLKGTRAYI